MDSGLAASRRPGMTNQARVHAIDHLQIPGAAQALERVLGLVIHGTAGALGNPGGREFADDLVDRARLRLDREGDVGVAERAVALARACEIERADRAAFPPPAAPH